MKFIEEKYRIVEFVSIFSFWKHFLEFFPGINFRGFELANFFADSNFRDFAEKPQKPRKLVPLRYSENHNIKIFLITSVVKDVFYKKSSDLHPTIS